MYQNQALVLAQEIGNYESEVVCLDTLGLIYHYLGQSSQAVEFYNQAIDIYQLLKNKREYGFVLTHLGYALTAIGHYEAAESNLYQALQIRRELGTMGLATDTLAGLALITMARGESEKAIETISEILSYIEDNGVEGIELPIQVYLICYRVLVVKAGIDPNYLSKANTVLDAGYKLLQERADQLQDDDMRSRFLEQVPYNRELHMAWLDSR